MQVINDYMETHDIIITIHNHTLDEIDLDNQICTVPQTYPT